MRAALARHCCNLPASAIHGVLKKFAPERVRRCVGRYGSAFERDTGMRKTLWLSLLVAALLLLGGYWYLRHSLRLSISKDADKTGQTIEIQDSLGGKKVSETDLRPLLIARVRQLLKKSSNGLYDLSVGDLKLDVFGSSMVLQGVQLKSDSTMLDSLRRIKQLPDDVVNVSFDSLRVEGIDLNDAITSTTMEYSLLKLVKPVITIHHLKKTIVKDMAEKEDFSQGFLKQMQKLSIKNVVVENGTVNLYNAVKNGAPTLLNQVSVHLNNLLLDSATRQDTSRFFFAESGAASFTNYSRPTPDGLYTMKIANVAIKAPQNEVVLTGFSFASPLNRTQFSKKLTKSKERYTLTLPLVTLSQVRWWNLLNEEELTVAALKTSGGAVDIFLDRSLPPRNKTGNFPSQLLMKIPLHLNIAKATMQNLDFSYGEYNPVSGATGTIYMDKVNLNITNISNQPRANPPPVVISGTARFMKQVPVQAQFRFNMKQYKSGAFTAHIKVQGFDSKLLNSFTVPMGMMKMERGRVQSAEATVQGNQQAATGSVYIPYNDLKLAILEKEGKELDKKDVTSFLANLLVLKNDNPKKGGAPRRETSQFTRIPEGGFFMLVWKTILVGALKTMGAPTKIASKTVSSPSK